MFIVKTFSVNEKCVTLENDENILWVLSIPNNEMKSELTEMKQNGFIRDFKLFFASSKQLQQLGNELYAMQENGTSIMFENFQNLTNFFLKKQPLQALIG